MAAPALAASIADCAICCGVTGTAGFFPGVSAEPVTAQEIMTLRCIEFPGVCRLRAHLRPTYPRRPVPDGTGQSRCRPRSRCRCDVGRDGGGLDQPIHLV